MSSGLHDQRKLLVPGGRLRAGADGGAVLEPVTQPQPAG